MQNYQITKLFFWKWYTNFFKATSQKHLCLAALLNEKLDQHLFFYKVDLEVYPSYQFWVQINTILDTFTLFIGPKNLEIEEKKFLDNPEHFLKQNLVSCLEYWKFYPQMFRDFWSYYPRYNISFDNVECIYLDFWTELPKVVDSLLSELLIRDVPLRKEIPVNPRLAALEASGIFVVMNYKKTFPPIKESQFSDEKMNQDIVEYLAGDDQEKVFFKVINFYLNSRDHIKSECISILKVRGLSLDDDSLVRYFLGEYIFQGVSNEAKRFFMANLDLKEKNPFLKAREASANKWTNFSADKKQDIIRRYKRALEEGQVRVNEKNSLTVTERVERFERARKRVQAMDFASLPKVSLSKLIKMGKETSNTDKG